MFTGLIEEIGRINELFDNNGTRRIVISSTTLARELKTGDSIAVNGVCLTALEITPGSFTADMAAETVHRTSLTRLRKGSLVNLELPAKSGARLGGHIVQGHVDGVGTLLGLERVSGGDDWQLTLKLPSGLEKYVVFKGSVSIEGISLTVARIEDALISIAVIPHTYNSTNLKSLSAGDPLNVEVDVIAKYAEKMLRSDTTSEITVDRLLSEGF